MTIGKQIGLSIGGMVAACALVGGTGWWSVSALGDRLDKAIAVSVRQADLAGDLKAQVFTFRLQERGMLLFSHIQDDGQVDKCRQAYDKGMSGAFERIGELRPLLRTEHGRGGMDRIQAAIEEYRSHQLEVRRLLAAAKVQEATEYDRQNLVADGGRIIAALDDFNQQRNGVDAGLNSEARSMRSTAKAALLVGLLICMSIGIAVSLAMRLATGKLRSTAAELGQAAQQVASAAAQVAASSTSLAQGASQQAASLEETSASSTQVSAMANKNSDLGRDAAGLVVRSQMKFEETSRSLAQTVAAMRELQSESGKIAGIIKTIDEIAFQTNILALNAAVEAARAGGAGLGFAVVADEVRTLAQRCAKAASDTSTLIQGSITKSGQGKARVDEVASAIGLILGEAGEIKTIVDEMSAGSSQQAEGIEQISRAIQRVEQVTQQTAANAEQGAAAAEELTAQSAALNGIMLRLTDLVGA